MDSNYEPKEDSFLILRHIKEHAKPDDKVLDLGTGSGILADEAAKHAREVIACDIKKVKTKFKNKRIKFIQSDLFSAIKVKRKFNLILFNPPYLPSNRIQDKRIDGGKHGTEIIDRFLKEAKKYLKKDGKILVVCSSLNKNIPELFKKYQYKYKKIDQENFFFEKIYLYLLFKEGMIIKPSLLSPRAK